MRRGTDWYKRDPIAFMDGVEGMGPELIGAYAYVLDLIYSRAGFSLRDDGALAGRMGCSKRKATSLIDQLIERGKIEVRDGYLTHKHAEEHSNTRRALSEQAASAGRKGGEKSGEVRKNKALAEADASISNEAEKRREEKKGSGGDSAHAREASPPPSNPPPPDALPPAAIREQILEAMGLDGTGVVGTSGKIVGNMADMAEYRRWVDDLNLDHQTILTVIRETCAAKSRTSDPEPPTKFSYFTKPMQRAAADLAPKPTLTPIAGGLSSDRPSDNPDHPRRAPQDARSQALAGMAGAFREAIADHPRPGNGRHGGNSD